MTARKDPLQDFIDFLSLLNEFGVNFIVVGAHAMSQWGYTRATGDLDILIRPTEKNATRLLAALKKFGSPTSQYTPADFTKKYSIFQIGVPPLRVDIINTIDGVMTERALKESKKGFLLGVPVRFLSLENLIQNKSATKRPKDKNDVIELRGLKGKKRNR